MQLVGPPPSHPEIVGDRGVCAGGHRCQAEAGARMFELGGNAIDAAVAAAFAGFVVEQVDCSLGGFAHVSVHDVRAGLLTFDGYVRAPASAHAEMFDLAGAPMSYYGHPQPVAARFGARAVAVPGAVAALCAAHQRSGRLARQAVLAPAIELARAGTPLTMRDVLAVARLRDRIEALPATEAWLLPRGALPTPSVQQPGDRLDTAALADTLARVAAEGPAGFYSGEVARAIAATIAELGGVLTADDLQDYRLRRRRERPIRHAGYELVTCHDHVAQQALGMIDRLGVAAMDPESVSFRHLMAEVLGVAFADGIAHFADSEDGAGPLAALRHPAYLARRAAMIHPERALPRPIAAGELSSPVFTSRPSAGALPARPGTSQMVAADVEGNVAAVCTALGWDFGSLVYVAEVGVMLNNGMSYFDPRPGRPASIAPGRMPMFGAPTVAARGPSGAALAVAGSGGYRIETGVLHTIVGHLDQGMSLGDAIAQPRVHCQGAETYVDARIAEKVRQTLERGGHQVVVLEEDLASFHFGRICAAECGADGTVSASGGPAWLTALAAV